MEALEIRTIFTLNLLGMAIPITETVVVSWGVMLVLIAASLILTRRLKEIPAGPQTFLETGVEFLNSFAKNQFGPFARHLGPYMGSLFLFLLLGNIIGVLSPVGFTLFGREFVPPFPLRPPARDINVTAALAVISMLLVIGCGFAVRGFGGWFKRLLHPFPVMLPFNIMDYGTRLLSLTLRLFGNILGGFVLMELIQKLLPVALPAVLSLYFDFFDGLMQAGIFVFLTSLYITEAVRLNEE
ncbi:MAG: F0F1 ATP synthase subunit A [Spirochaetaceae bacterium]|jgi:F-type H+-transporting ATPase subunit a|nr:F0F1 ATP synthase subunit A [Spirochaetaceae bacterium]